MIKILKNNFLTCIPCVLLSLLVFATPSIASQETDIQRLNDTAAINKLVTSYMRIYDSLDPDAFSGLFSKDAVVYTMGQEITGDDNIRQIVIGLKAQFDKMKEDGKQIWVFHQLNNSEISNLTETSADHQAVWTATVIDSDGKTTTPIIGGYKDKLVKQNGEWLISERRILSFGPPPKMPL